MSVSPLPGNFPMRCQHGMSQDVHGVYISRWDMQRASCRHVVSAHSVKIMEMESNPV